MGYGLGALSSPALVGALGVLGSALLAFCVLCGLMYGF
jgi:hypothetical protein